MTQKPLFRGIVQIGLVVKNVEATAKRCWQDFGVGPWEFHTFDPSHVEDMKIRGKRVDHAMRIGNALIGDVYWEIIEPLDDRSIYAEHLQAHGEGLHHVMFDVENYSEAKAHMGRIGCQEVAGGSWSGFPYSYFDANQSLACLAEIWLPPAPGQELPPPDGTYPRQGGVQGQAAMAATPIFKGISHVGLAVKSVEATAKRCWECFGIGPWTFYTFNPSSVKEMTIRGKRVDHAIRIASTTIGNMEWEIIEPLDDRSIYAEHLREHGEGLHHVMFDVDRYDEAKSYIRGTGCQEVISGVWFGHPYSYFDTRTSLACLTEIWSPPTPGTVLPPPDGSYP